MLFRGHCIAPGPRKARSEVGLTNPRKGAVALDKTVLYLTWLVPVLEGFPKSQRFLLGDRLQTQVMDLMDYLIEATYTKAPQPLLRRANLMLEKQRLLIRVAYNLKHLDVRRYEFAARKLDEIGQSVGAWLKASATQGVAPVG